MECCETCLYYDKEMLVCMNEKFAYYEFYRNPKYHCLLWEKDKSEQKESDSM